jgi:hypothetical protein
MRKAHRGIITRILVALLFISLSACGTPASTAANSTSTGAGSRGTSTPVSPTETVRPTPTPIPRVLLPVRGVIGPFERRGFPSGYYEGQILREFNNYDQFVGGTAAQEIGLQLDAMRSMGINTITLTLSAADHQPGGAFVPPACPVNPDLGPLFPQPTETEMTNLKALFDLVNSKGIQIVLNLSNTHMEDQAGSETWLRSILEVVKDHPALYLVLFGGDIHIHHYDAPGVSDFCGGRAEPPLYEGPGVGSIKYLKWALSLAHSLGIPYRKLSAEAILGCYACVAQAPNQFMTDGHYWSPEAVLKGIFDDLNIPNDQRTFAISFYEQHKCNGTLPGLTCEDAPPHQWALETINRLFDVIGRDNGARVVAVETGYLTPLVTDWNTELALESLVWIYQAYGIEGCGFWLWTNFQNSEDLDPTRTPPVKQRGPGFNYNPVKDILQQLYTQGQTNDLMLTPDTVPPAFTSVAASPRVVKNGDQVEITATLGETHLFVWVDLSPLDSDKSSQVVLIDQGDGTYKREVPLSAWNVQPNGTRSLKVTAMDFWSNIATTSVEVELQNAAPVLDINPPNDDFSGTRLDASKWKTDLAGGATVTQDGQAVLSITSQEKYSAANVYPTWTFPGDFDVQIDFQIGKGWQSPSEGHLDGAVFGVDIGGQRYWVTHLMSGGTDSLYSMNSVDDLIGQMYTDTVSGKYRLLRQGTSLFILFDIGAGWQKIISKTGPEGPALVYFGNGSISASHAFTTYFDNFKINSGVTTYKP